MEEHEILLSPRLISLPCLRATDKNHAVSVIMLRINCDHSFASGFKRPLKINVKFSLMVLSRVHTDKFSNTQVAFGAPLFHHLWI